MMTIQRAVPMIFLVGMLAPAIAMAQDADKKKLADIEAAFAKNATNGPEAAAVGKQYLYDGPLAQLTGTGRIGVLPKARVVEILSKNDPSDPNVKQTSTISDVKVQLFDDTALVTYKAANTDTGHKDPALNTTEHYGCMDTFVKRKGSWLMVGDACAHEGPMAAATWEAIKKERTQEPKDVQQAYH